MDIEKLKAMGLEVHTITELTYAEKSGPGPWRLYIYDEHDFHSGGKWFRNGNVKHPDEEISKEEAYQNCVATILLKCEVRICDGGDHLVFHAQNGEVIYGENFWEELGFDLRKMAANAGLVDLKKQGLSRDGLCISCHKPALPRCYSEAGRREYSISGLCEKCFDEACGSDE